MTKIFQDRFLRNDATGYEARQDRQTNKLKLYQKPTIGWKLSCESSVDSGDNFTRQEAFDMMFEKTLNTQSDNLRSTMFYGPLFVAILAGIMILMSLVIAL